MPASFADLGVEEDEGYSPIVNHALPMNENVERFLRDPYPDDYRRLLTTLIGNEDASRSDAAYEEFVDAIDDELPEIDESTPREDLLKIFLTSFERQLERF